MISHLFLTLTAVSRISITLGEFLASLLLFRLIQSLQPPRDQNLFLYPGRSPRTLEFLLASLHRFLLSCSQSLVPGHIQPRESVMLPYWFGSLYRLTPSFQGILNFRAHLGQRVLRLCPLILQLLVPTSMSAYTTISLAPGGPRSTDLLTHKSTTSKHFAPFLELTHI